ncbi:HET-domain-containing protein, partial [Polyplosphaeria fusca]
MRLLQRLPGGNFQLTSFDDDDRAPRYAILSHTWTEGQEVTYHDLIDGTGNDKTGFEKIRFCSEQAAIDGLQYFWVDTCCIDKSTSDELSTAINSMFKWYRRATKCYVYLSDVSVPGQVADAAAFQITWVDTFRRSRWFTRGWTLQELLAPPSVEFFSIERKRLGSKISLEQEIHKTTKIPISVLRGHDLSNVSIDGRMSWAASRMTTIKEDRVYCLLGIFGVFLPLIYGEGEAHARMRLEEEIQKQRGHELGQTCNFSAGKLAPRTTMPLHITRLETARATCVIPFRRDPDFTDRGTLLDEVRKKCLTPASRIALVGLGGVGKSQLAIEHCYRTADRFPGTWVFWVHAGSATRLEQSYRDIASQVELPGQSEPQANIFELVRNWLRDEKNGKWLLVLDNADDSAVLTSLLDRVQGHLSRYLPPSKYGSTIVTSRAVSVASHLVEEQDIIHIKPMQVTDAQNLLQKKLRGDVAADEVNELAVALEYMPLALVQAAAYISKRGPHFSIQQYLQEFRKNDKRKISLLNQEAGHLRRNEEAKNSIIITWQISFEHIRRTRRSAADILSLMSFFDRQGIPKALLLGSNVPQSAPRDVQADDGEESNNAKDDDSALDYGTDDSFIDDILTLRDYSFVSETTDPGTLEMHSLVQLATQKWLEGRGEVEGWRQQFISTLFSSFPTGQYENWNICRSLFPHAIAASAKRPRDKQSRKEWAELMYNAAWYAWQRGDIHEAESLAIASM